MKNFLSFIAIILLTGCSIGEVELTKEAAFCEINGETFRSGEKIPLSDGCNFCVCSADGELENCTEKKCEIETPSIGLANPAAVKCVEDDFSYEIRTAEDGGQFGVCIDEQNRECDEWEYFRGECALGDSAISAESEIEVAEPEPGIVEDESPVEPEEVVEPEIENVEPVDEPAETPEVDSTDADEVVDEDSDEI